MPDWKVTLNGSTLCGGDCTGDATVDACLLAPPEGTGPPPRRTEDVTYPQRDGVEHFADWYEPRILTMQALIGDSTGCGCSGDARAHSRSLMTAWSRACEDDELVLWTGCGQSSVNLVQNGSFDVNAAHWTSTFNTTLTRSTTQFHSAPASLRAEVGVLGGMAFRSDQFAVEAGVTYMGRTFVRAGTSTGRFVLQISFFDIDGNQTGTTIESFRLLDSNSAWTELIVSALAPAAAVVAELSVQSSDATGSGTFHYFDDFTVLASGGVADGPFGVIGRARISEPLWRRGRKPIADVTLRFDAVDQRLYVLDAFGTPGSGTQCYGVTNTPDAPGEEYAAAIALQDVDHHWPLDAGHMSTPLQADDVIGSSPVLAFGPGASFFDAATPAAPISIVLGTSSMQGKATLATDQLWTGSYGSGMVGWWHVVDPESTTAGVSLYLDSTHGVGLIPSTETVAASATWGGSAVALNPGMRQALGFDDDFRGQAVFVIATWNASNLWLAAEVPDGLGGFTQVTQTISATGGLVPGGFNAGVRLLGARASNMIAGVGSYGSAAVGQGIATAAAAAFLDAPDNAILIPDVGELCGPIQITFYDPTSPPTIVAADGNFIGSGLTGSQITIDTDQGTSLLNGTVDATAQITGDPFIQVSPGDVLYAYGGGQATVCFRPSVISA